MSIDERISEALRRLVAGMGAMRIPADPCDADLVLSDVQTELATLRTQLATVTRERDSWRAQRDEVHAEMERQTQLKREERQAKLDAMRERDERQKALEVALEERTSALAERNWANERHDEARADAARLREALEDVRDDIGVMRTSAHADAVEACGANAESTIAAALASTPSAEPTRTDAERWLGDGPEEPGGTMAFHAEPTPAVHSSHFSEPLSEDPEVLSACVDTPEPTPRDMRVAEAVREACVETADASDEASRRVAGDLRDLDLAAVVTKAVKP